MEKLELDEEINTGVSGSIVLIILSVLLAVLGGVMLAFPQMEMTYFAYFGGACLLVWGIWLISRYFLYKQFHQTSNYGFSVGTLVVILGAVALIRVEDVTKSIPTYLGILVLIESVVMLQNTVQLKNLKGQLWGLSLILAVLSTVGSLVILLDIMHIISKHMEILYGIQIVVGISALLCMLLVNVRTKKFHKTDYLSNDEITEENESISEEMQE